MSGTSNAEYLRARYGSKNKDRRAIRVIALVLAAIAVIWIAWQAVLLARPTASAQPLALQVVSDSEVVVTYNLTAPVGSKVTCTVTAYTEALTEVGVRQVTVGPTENKVTAVSITVATIQRATGANVEDCVIIEP